MVRQPMPTPRKSSARGQHIVPPGTQVVTLANVKSPEGVLLHKPGAVAVIIEAPARPAAPYRVRFPDGTVANLSRRSFEPRKERAKSILAVFRTPPHDLYEYVVYRCIVGSRAYGLDDSDSDIDRRGIYLPPAEKQWSLWGLPEQLERHESQECYWELEKFLRLALRANPNALECLYTPLVEFATPLAKELLAMRSVFLTRTVYQTYNGYVLSQFKKIAQDRRNSGRIRWKHAMHLIRLLLSGITILKEQQVHVQVTAYREKLLAIRRGNWEWAEVDAWRKQLHKEFDAAFARSTLPEHPDYDRVNSFLLKARRSML
jgi:predicted nucleotidyltransferase